MTKSKYKCNKCKDTGYTFCQTHSDGRGFNETCVLCARIIDPANACEAQKLFQDKYQKLLEFVKFFAKQEKYMKYFLTKHGISPFEDCFADKATNLLKEIGEL